MAGATNVFVICCHMLSYLLITICFDISMLFLQSMNYHVTACCFYLGTTEKSTHVKSSGTILYVVMLF